MTTRERLDHASTAQVEHQDERATDLAQTRYPAADQDTSYRNSDPHMLQFTDELKAINDKAATAFDNRDNLADYTSESRLEFMKSYVEAFNKVDFNNNFNDRMAAANDISQTVFKPLYETVEIAEFKNQLKGDKDTIDAIEAAGIKYVDLAIDQKTGQAGIEFDVKDLETARALVEQTGGAVQFVTSRGLDHHQERFVHALMTSDSNQEFAAHELHHTFNAALAYTKGEQYQQPEFTWLNDNEDAAVTDKNQVDQAIRTLAGMEEVQRDYVIDQLVNQKWADTQEALEKLHYNQAKDAEGAQQALDSLKALHAEALTEAYQNNNEETFRLFVAQMPEHSKELAKAIEFDTGFITAEDYKNPALPERFNNTTEARVYLEEVRGAIDHIKTTEGYTLPIGVTAIEEMAAEFQRKLEYAEEAGRASTGADVMEQTQILYQLAEDVHQLPIEDFIKPRLPESFENLREADTYVNQLIGAINGHKMDTPSDIGLATHAIMLEERLNHAHEIDQADPSTDLSEEYLALHRKAEGINYLLKPTANNQANPQNQDHTT